MVSHSLKVDVLLNLHGFPGNWIMFFKSELGPLEK